jgi:hypothetical protein
MNPGKPLVVFTLWRVETALATDLAAFMHLVDGAGQIVAQHDGFDAVPITLQSGDIVLQRHVLPAVVAEEAAQYDVFVGVYLRNSQQRLSFAVEEEAEMEDRFKLVTVIIDEK